MHLSVFRKTRRNRLRLLQNSLKISIFSNYFLKGNNKHQLEQNHCVRFKEELFSAIYLFCFVFFSFFLLKYHPCLFDHLTVFVSLNEYTQLSYYILGFLLDLYKIRISFSFHKQNAFVIKQNLCKLQISLFCVQFLAIYGSRSNISFLKRWDG